MKPLIVLDACTILNLLRIDHDDDYLLKQLKSLRLFVPETVFSETKRHIWSDFYPKEKNDHIEVVLNVEFGHRKTLDRVIKNDLKDDFKKLVNFSRHKKRENGELYCVALALLKSREEHDTVTLFTDDYRATEEFKDFYRYHQIGNIGDTLDLLTMLYWSTAEKDFQNALYKSFLNNLKAEFNHQLNSVVESINKYLEKKKKSKCSNRELMENLNNIVEGYRHANMDQMESGIRFFQEGNKYNEVKKIVANIDVHKVNVQMKRITEHLERLNDYPIFKLL